MLFSTAEIPTPHEQLKFLKHIQQILQSGTFTSTYKFALLISITRLAIEQGQDTGAALHLEYQDIAEKFIDLYWKQSLPFQFNQYEPFSLNKPLDSKQKSSVKSKGTATIQDLGRTENRCTLLEQAKANSGNNGKANAGVYLQNLNGQTVEFL
jgi:hypothetical protein